jgi:ferredoxin-NADP reductase
LLACLCRPEGDLELGAADAARSFESRIERLEVWSEEVTAVYLSRPPELEFEPGQFVQVTRLTDGLTRPYSLASLPGDGPLELHVQRRPGGRMSNWLSEQGGAPVRLTGPFGECCYAGTDPGEPLLLAATGTGLAPLIGVLRAALRARHSGQIRLYHAAHAARGWYRRAELEAMAERHPNLTVRLTRGRATADPRSELSALPGIERAVFEDVPNPRDERIYLCGNPDFVHTLRRRAYLSGASLSKIHADAFVEAPPPGLVSSPPTDSSAT